jgi:hypothetical protein
MKQTGCPDDPGVEQNEAKSCLMKNIAIRQAV